MFTIISRQNKTLGREENLLAIQVSVCYILKHLEDRKARSVHIYYTWCDIILIFKLHRRTRLKFRSSTHSLKIRMMSHLCNKYEQITLSYLLSVKHFKHFATRKLINLSLTGITETLESYFKLICAQHKIRHDKESW